MLLNSSDEAIKAVKKYIIEFIIPINTAKRTLRKDLHHLDTKYKKQIIF